MVASSGWFGAKGSSGARAWSARPGRGLSRVPAAAQPLDEQRVVGERVGPVDDLVELPAVLGGGAVEELPDGGRAGIEVLPPLALEGQDPKLPVGQAGHGRKVRGASDKLTDQVV